MINTQGGHLTLTKSIESENLTFKKIGITLTVTHSNRTNEHMNLMNTQAKL
jgi:hypothetical protein